MNNSSLKTKSLSKKNKSQNGTGHVRKRKDGRWEGQFYINGKRGSCYGETEGECRGQLNVILGKIFKGSYVDGSILPLYSYLNYWHNSFTEVKPATHTNYETYIEKHIFQSKISSIPIKRLRLDDFINFFREKQISGRLDGESGGLSPKTIHNIRYMLSEALDFAVNNLKWIESNPLNGLKTPKVTIPQIRVFEREYQYNIEQAALKHENKNALMVLIDLYTGMRIGELCALSWNTFGPQKEYFEIRHIIERLYKKWAENRGDYQEIPLLGTKPSSDTALYLGSPKTESGKRRIYTSKQAVICFNEIEAYQKQRNIYKPDGFVFLQKNGNPYEPRTYNRLYRDVLKRAEVDYRNFHTLRHTFATRAFELAFDIPTLAEILGHAQKSTTENMYGHSLDDTKKKAMEKFNLFAG